MVATGFRFSRVIADGGTGLSADRFTSLTNTAPAKVVAPWVPAGDVSITVAAVARIAGIWGNSATLLVGLQDAGGNALPIVNAAGGTYVPYWKAHEYGLLTPPTVTPVWTHAGGPLTLFLLRSGNVNYGHIAVSYSPATVNTAWSALPSGTPLEWRAAGGTTMAPPTGKWDASGPWETSEASGTTLKAVARISGTQSVTVPVWAHGGDLNVSMAGPVTLVSADGATVNGDGSLTIPADDRRRPEWLATGDCTVTLRKEAAGAYVVGFAPAILAAPTVPPTPPTITKLIPTSGPDTGGTVVDVVGTDLTGATAVDFGGTAGTGLTVDPSGGLATVTSPAHTAGPAPVTITTPAGTSAAKTFTFEAPLPPGGPVVVAVIPAAARPGATIQIVGTNLTDATVTMCGDPVAIVSNDGTIITVVVPPGCTDGETTITVTTPDGETTADFTVLPVPEPGECPSLTDWCGPDTPCPDCVPCVVAPDRPLIAMWADLAAQIRCGWPDDRCPPGAVTVEATQQPLGSDCDAEVQVIPGGPAGADHAGVTTWGGRVVVLRPWAQINEAGQITDAAQAQRLEALARSLEDLQIMQQLIGAAACGSCGPGGATIDRVDRVTSTTTLGWAFTVRIS